MQLLISNESFQTLSTFKRLHNEKVQGATSKWKSVSRTQIQP